MVYFYIGSCRDIRINLVFWKFRLVRMSVRASRFDIDVELNLWVRTFHTQNLNKSGHAILSCIPDTITYNLLIILLLFSGRRTYHRTHRLHASPSNVLDSTFGADEIIRLPSASTARK